MSNHFNHLTVLTSGLGRDPGQVADDVGVHAGTVWRRTAPTTPADHPVLPPTIRRRSIPAHERTARVANARVPTTLLVPRAQHVLRQSVPVVHRTTRVLRYDRQYDLTQHVPVSRTCTNCVTRNVPE